MSTEDLIAYAEAGQREAESAATYRLARLAYPNRVSCQYGCAHCCYYGVVIGQPDALILADWCRRHAKDTPEFRSLLKDRALLMEQHLGNHRSYVEKHIPCALLKDDACMAYEWRPVPCRTHFVVSPAELCKTADLTQIKTVDMDPVRQDAGAFARGFKKSTTREGPLMGSLPRMLLWALGYLEETT